MYVPARDNPIRHAVEPHIGDVRLAAVIGSPETINHGLDDGEAGMRIERGANTITDFRSDQEGFSPHVFLLQFAVDQLVALPVALGGAFDFFRSPSDGRRQGTHATILSSAGAVCSVILPRFRLTAN